MNTFKVFLTQEVLLIFANVKAPSPESAFLRVAKKGPDEADHIYGCDERRNHRVIIGDGDRPLRAYDITENNDLIRLEIARIEA
jgi:hypothetical protein